MSGLPTYQEEAGIGQVCPAGDGVTSKAVVESRSVAGDEKLEPSCPKRLPALASHKAAKCNAEPMAKAPAWRGRGLRVGVERQLRRGGLWPAAGLVDTEIRFSNLIGGFHAATSVQPRIQA